MELGADDMDAMVEAFQFENKARVQRFYSDWDAAKKKLNSQLPEPRRIDTRVARASPDGNRRFSDRD